MREKIFIWIAARIFKHEPGVMLNLPLKILQTVLFPLKTIHYYIHEHDGFQPMTRVWLIHGIKYSDEVFRHFAYGDDKLFKIIKREDGIVTIKKMEDSYPDKGAKILPFAPDYAVHPGEILEETLEARGMSKATFARRCGLSDETVSQIIDGKTPVTPEMAIQFEYVLGVSASVWNNLEASYRLHTARATTTTCKILPFKRRWKDDDK